MCRAGPLCCAVLLGTLVPGAVAGDAQTSEAIRRLTSSDAEVSALYEPGGAAPLWTDERGALLVHARHALRLMLAAADEGLEPADYGAAELRARAQQLTSQPDPAAIADVDVSLSRAMLRYLHDLRSGRAGPFNRGSRRTAAEETHDLARVLRQAVERRQIIATARWVAPRWPEYAALRLALARYRSLAVSDAPLHLAFTASVHPGEQYGALPLLQARLALLGDATGPVSAADVYEGAIVDAVRRFQQRHGLAVDGVLGKQTLAALEVPIAARVRQIELAMERLRWMPRTADSRLLLVNIPMFRLYAWDSIPPVGVPAFSTGVIVGRAVDTRTPVFAATLSEILYRPYWNVPTSIVRNEILPRLASDPGYLVRERMELVNGQGDNAPIVEATEENLGRLRQGTVRLRQRPGPTNSLGLIKFSLPNAHDVYLHSTPARALFSRTRRDFSHGCVRVEDPLGLAEWVLSSTPGWDRDRIAAAMEAEVSSRVPVRSPVQVMLVYSTATVLLDSGDVAFADDIYGDDARLDRALRARP